MVFGMMSLCIFSQTTGRGSAADCVSFFNACLPLAPFPGPWSSKCSDWSLGLANIESSVEIIYRNLLKPIEGIFKI